MRFSKKKSASIEIQFNWIFVLIVGALILVFFINISSAQRKNADQKLAFDLTSKIDLIMSGALAIPKTGQIFDMPNIPFNLECSAISTSGVQKQFPDRIIFGPDVLKGKSLVIFSEDWTVPFKVTNFLYITTSNVRYIVVVDPTEVRYEEAEKFYNSLPDNITKEMSSLENIKDKNNYKIRLIFLEEIYDHLTGADLADLPLPAFMEGLPESALSGVYITGANEDSIATVQFIKKDRTGLLLSGEEIDIYKEPMIFGAIFAENKEQFNCSYMKAFKKLYYISQVYEKREELLVQGYLDTSQQECKAPETRDTNRYIESMGNAALDQNVGLINANEIYIAQVNNQAVRYSCASIY
jgi:hypothetical protein